MLQTLNDIIKLIKVQKISSTGKKEKIVVVSDEQSVDESQIEGKQVLNEI